MVHAIGDALADEVGQLLDQVGILQQDGAVGCDRERVLVTADGTTRFPPKPQIGASHDTIGLQRWECQETIRARPRGGVLPTRTPMCDHSQWASTPPFQLR